jgi:hypothetical protein
MADVQQNRYYVIFKFMRRQRVRDAAMDPPRARREHKFKHIQQLVSILKYVVLFFGDLGTYERVQGVLLRRSIEGTPWLRHQFMVLVMGFFHLKNDPKMGRLDENSLMAYVTQSRPRESDLIPGVLKQCLVSCRPTPHCTSHVVHSAHRVFFPLAKQHDVFFLVSRTIVIFLQSFPFIVVFCYILFLRHCAMASIPKLLGRSVFQTGRRIFSMAALTCPHIVSGLAASFAGHNSFFPLRFMWFIVSFSSLAMSAPFAFSRSPMN